MGRQIAFFFGSGISYATGMPQVAGITKSALEDEWHLQTLQRYLPGPNGNPNIPDLTTPKVQEFLHSLSQIAKGYIADTTRAGSGAPPHYEDLYSLAEQARRVNEDHVPNLAVVPFWRELEKETKELHSNFEYEGTQGLQALAAAACDFLHWVVYENLQLGKREIKGLDVLSSIANEIDSVDLFTLNHDLLIEGKLNAEGVSYEDGFDTENGQCRIYSSKWWGRSRKQTVRLFKLHGSINWYLFRFESGLQQYGIPLGDSEHTKDGKGAWADPLDKGQPAFLSGTIVKELRYSLGFWDELLFGFRNQMDQHHHLICCGYGFGDTAINHRIRQWVHNHPTNKLVILEQRSKEDFLGSCPYWVSSAYQKGRIIWIDKYLQSSTLEDLEPYFDTVSS